MKEITSLILVAILLFVFSPFVFLLGIDAGLVYLLILAVFLVAIGICLSIRRYSQEDRNFECGCDEEQAEFFECSKQDGDCPDCKCKKK